MSDLLLKSDSWAIFVDPLLRFVEISGDEGERASDLRDDMDLQSE